MNPSSICTALAVLAAAFATYLVVLTLVASWALATGSLKTWAASLRALPRPARRLVGALATVAAVSVSPAAKASAEPAEAPPPASFTLRSLEATPSTTTSSLLGDPVADIAPEQAPAQAPATWTVAPGQHFWSIAEEVTKSRNDDESSVTDYWLRLIAANRSRLPDPANPDFVRPGLVLDLPSAI